MSIPATQSSFTAWNLRRIYSDRISAERTTKHILARRTTVSNIVFLYMHYAAHALSRAGLTLKPGRHYTRVHGSRTRVVCTDDRVHGLCSGSTFLTTVNISFCPHYTCSRTVFRVVWTDAREHARQHQRYGSVNPLFQTQSKDSSFLLLLAYQRIRGFACMRYINPRLIDWLIEHGPWAFDRPLRQSFTPFSQFYKYYGNKCCVFYCLQQLNHTTWTCTVLVWCICNPVTLSTSVMNHSVYKIYAHV